MQIAFQRVYFHYRGPFTGNQKALEDINLNISDNEFIALVGPTGSGKTTLIQHLTGLLIPTSGKVLIDHQDLADKKMNLTAIRRKISLVFQFPEAQLFEETVFADVAFGPKNLGLTPEQIETAVNTALQQVNLNPIQFGPRSPFNLSEGEKRRVAIAGVLAMNPTVLALDEPTAGLDPSGVHIIEKILCQLHQSGKTIILITHNMDLVARIAHRVIALKKGKIIWDGNKNAFFSDLGLLANAGLDLPRIAKILDRYRSKGLDLDRNIYALEELQRFIATQRK